MLIVRDSELDVGVTSSKAAKVLVGKFRVPRSPDPISGPQFPGTILNYKLIYYSVIYVHLTYLQ